MIDVLRRCQRELEGFPEEIRGELADVIYVVIQSGVIYLLHAFKKKTRETPLHNIEVAKKRLKEVR